MRNCLYNNDPQDGFKKRETIIRRTIRHKLFIAMYAREVRSPLWESGHLQQRDQADALNARCWF